MELAIKKARPERWRTVVNFACIVIIALALLADLADLVGYLRTPAAYPIGAEAAGVRYASRAHFFGATCGAIVLYVIGLVGPALMKDKRRKTAMRLAVALWVVASTAWFAFTSG